MYHSGPEKSRPILLDVFLERFKGYVVAITQAPDIVDVGIKEFFCVGKVIDNG